MYRFETDRGFLLYPCNKEDFNEPFLYEKLYIEGNTENRILEKIGMAIPQQESEFKNFARKMVIKEKALKEYFSKVIKSSLNARNLD